MWISQKQLQWQLTVIIKPMYSNELDQEGFETDVFASVTNGPSAASAETSWL